MKNIPVYHPVVKHVTPNQVTQFYTNKSPVLSWVIKRSFGEQPLELLGEFQMVFISFMIG